MDAADDFYHFANKDWLGDESVVIPGDYPRWGSFIKLADESLHNQIKLVEELESTDDLSEDEKKLMVVWRKSMDRFSKWDNGEGDFSSIYSNLVHLENSLGEGSWTPESLAKFMAWCERTGVKSLLGLGTLPNLESSEDIVLELGPGNGLSMPSRDYYLKAEFEKQREMFKRHLESICIMIGADHLQDNFVERVIRFETKLAQITMKDEQSRNYDKYFTATTLSSFVAEINLLKSLDQKENNYDEVIPCNFDADLDLMKSRRTELNESEIDMAQCFFDIFTEELNLKSTMTDNFLKNYPGEIDASEKLIVFDGDFIRRIFPLVFRESNAKDILAFFQYKIILCFGSTCTRELDEAIFDLYSRKFGGQVEQKSWLKRSVGLVNAYLGELLGKIYVKRYFPETSKTSVEGMIKVILEIMKQSLEKNDWLTESTKKQALSKLSRFIYKIGYPNKFKSFDSLVLTDSDTLGDIKQKVLNFEFQTEFLDKINTKKDKLKWEMNPQTVNAYFHPLNNEIVFPAAILQSPFFSPAMDSVDMRIPTHLADCSDILTPLNFGGIGSVIAHELTHGFDDQGRKFDEFGNMKDWWTEEDDALFKKKMELMVEQASSWKFHVDGKEYTLNPHLTMGENLADLGGLSLSCQALVAHQQKHGVTGDEAKKQLEIFFLSWANIWKQKATDEWSVKQLSTDPHSPSSFRANLVKNIDAFYSVFQVKSTDKMFLAPEKRVCMW